MRLALGRASVLNEFGKKRGFVVLYFRGLDGQNLLEMSIFLSDTLKLCFVCPDLFINIRFFLL